MKQDMLRKLMGEKDSNSLGGILARGANVYPKGNHATSGGGKQYGRPKKNDMQAAARRRMNRAKP